MKRPTICLNMIVKNEEHVILETLECVAPLIDAWVVVDTGSTDRTKETVREFFERAGIPGELHERPWRDFGTNRTEALELARGKADYTWVIDADDIVVGELELGDLTCDTYLLRIGQQYRYWRRQLFKSSLRWRYEGVVHEYAICQDGDCSEARLDGHYHIESRRLGDRNRAADKYQRDCTLLHEALEKDPDNRRNTFYLAQSYFDAGNRERALDYYRKRASMGGWNEEIFYSLLRSARCMQDLGRPFEQVLPVLLEAHQSRPTRSEPLHDIARHYRLAGQHDLAYLFARRGCEIPFPETDTLFVFKETYDWRLRDELCIAAYWTNHHRECFDLGCALLDDSKVPESERPRIESNRDFAVEKIKDTFTVYPEERIEQITRRVRAHESTPEVTATITSCKRIDLFEKTMDSFLNCCTDADRIDRWICVDDNSDAADRQRMQDRYPFFEFVFKDEADRGHTRSMNLILERLESPWWIHLEDDWHFFTPLPYVGRGIEVLEDDPGLGQLLFNRNYAEALTCRDIVGGEVRTTNGSGTRYRVHTHIPRGTQRYTRFFAGFGGPVRSNVWWPHYSLRPSLLRTDAIRRVGGYDESAAHFELEYAQRWTDAGIRSAFIDMITCLHTGRRTWEQGSADNPNAYDLNDEPQFAGREKTGPRRVRLMCDWTSGENLCRQWDRQSKGDRRWEEIEITGEDRDIDNWVIVNRPGRQDAGYDPARTIVMHMEPLRGVRSWGEWSAPDPSKFLQVRDHCHHRNNLEWHLSWTYDELKSREIEKTRRLSSVTSSRAEDPGQRLRVDFLKYIEKHGVPIDVFGRDNAHGLKSHLGPLPPHAKDEGIFPYRYTFAAENFAEHNYFTEKIVDAIVGECLCFYWGCPNIEDHIDPEVFIRLDLTDPAQALRTMNAAMDAGEWERRLPVIRREKDRILEDLQFFPTLRSIILNHEAFGKIDCPVINLDRRPDRWNRFVESVGPRLGMRYRREAAVDGESLTMTDEIHHLFRGNDFSYRQNIVGCALSHMGIWRELAKKEKATTLVLEDDITLASRFSVKLDDVLEQVRRSTPEFDIVFLGHSVWPKHFSPEIYSNEAPPFVLSMDFSKYMGGTYGYLISSQGARRLIEIATRDGIQKGIDWFIRDKRQELNIYSCLPHIVHSSFAWPGESGDSDIQHSKTSLVTQ